MQTVPRHLVDRVRFDVTVESRAHGLAVQERLSVFQRARLAIVVDECVENTLGPSASMSVGRLTLDLGDIPGDALEREVESRLRRALTAALQRARGTSRARPGTDASAAAATPAQRLLHLMTTGRLGWTLQGEAVDADEMMRLALHDPATSVVALAEALLLTPVVRRRVAHQLSRESRRLLVDILRREREARSRIAERVTQGASEGFGNNPEAAPEYPLSQQEWASWLAAALAPERLASTSARRALAPLFGEWPLHWWSGNDAAVAKAAGPVLDRTTAQRLASHVIRYVPARSWRELLVHRHPELRAMRRALAPASGRERLATGSKAPVRRAHQLAVERWTTALVASLSHPPGPPPDEVMALTQRDTRAPHETLAVRSPQASRIAEALANRLHLLLRFGDDDATARARVQEVEAQVARLGKPERTRWRAHARALALTVERDEVMRARWRAWASPAFSAQLSLSNPSTASADASATRSRRGSGRQATPRASEVRRLNPTASPLALDECGEDGPQLAPSAAEVLAFLASGAVPERDGQVHLRGRSSPGTRDALVRSTNAAWVAAAFSSTERTLVLDGLRRTPHREHVARSLASILPSHAFESLLHAISPALGGFACTIRRVVTAALMRLTELAEEGSGEARLARDPRDVRDSDASVVPARYSPLETATRAALLLHLLAGDAPHLSASATFSAAMTPLQGDEHGRRALPAVLAIAAEWSPRAPRYALLDDVARSVFPFPYEQNIERLSSERPKSRLPRAGRGARAPRQARGPSEARRSPEQLGTHDLERRQRPTARGWSQLVRWLAHGLPSTASMDGAPATSPSRRFRQLLRQLERRVAREYRPMRREEGLAARSILTHPLARLRLAHYGRMQAVLGLIEAANSPDAPARDQRDDDVRAHELSTRRARVMRSVRSLRRLTSLLGALLAADDAEQSTASEHYPTGDDHSGGDATSVTAEMRAGSQAAVSRTRADGPPTDIVPHARRQWRRLVREALLEAVAASPVARGAATLERAIERNVAEDAVRRAVQHGAELHGLSANAFASRLRARLWRTSVAAAQLDASGQLLELLTGAGTHAAQARRAAPATRVRRSDDVLQLSDDPVAAGMERESFQVTGAGLVLVWPLLEHYFRSLALTSDGAFRTTQDAARGVLLLHHLATGDDGAPEPVLVLGKLLCGVPFDTPIPRRLELTEEERTWSLQLLSVVTQRWTPLVNTSIPTLRETFLQRDGRLARGVDETWELTVATRAYDVLLDRLPWSLSPVRLPWMPNLLHVRWRS